MKRFDAILATYRRSVVCGLLQAQTNWTFDSTLEAASDVVVADIVKTEATIDGLDIHRTATLQIVRVLRGDLAVGADLAIDWRYPADFSIHKQGAPPLTAKGALFLLRRDDSGNYAPLQAGESPSAVDRYLMSARKSTPTGALAYTEETPLASKIAREQAAVLESIATKHETDLAQDSRAQGQFTDTVNRFRMFHPAAMADVYRAFAVSPNPYLWTFGLEGEIRAGDGDAMVALEADAARLAPAFRMLPPAEIAMSINPRKELAATHALARLALNETNFGNLDGMVAGILGRAGSLEMLPYLMVMLRSPNPFISDAAVMSVCNLLRPGLKESETSHCPMQSPLADRAEAQTNQRFWLDWWGIHRDQIAQTVNLPVVAVPARYNAAPSALTTAARADRADYSLESRFARLIRSATDPPFDLEDDQKIFAALKPGFRKQMEEHMHEDRDRMNAARAKHETLDGAALEAGFYGLVKNQLEECRSRLSPGGKLNLDLALGLEVR